MSSFVPLKGMHKKSISQELLEITDAFDDRQVALMLADKCPSLAGMGALEPAVNRVDRYFIRVMVGLLLFLFVMIGLAVSRISDADEGDPTNVPRAANHHRHR